MGTIAVVGAGNVGLAIAGHMTLEGHAVRLFAPDESEFADIHARGGIELFGVVTGLAVPEMLTTDVAAAVSGADLVVVAAPAFAHGAISRRLAEVVEPDQLVAFKPGSLGSGLELSTHLQRAGRRPCSIAETATSLYTCRLRGPARVYVGTVKPQVRLGSVPAAAVADDRSRLAAYFGDRYAAEPDTLAVGIARSGAVYHVPPAVLGFRTVEQAARLPMNTLVTPRIAEVMDGVDRERLRLASALGVTTPSFWGFLESAYGVGEGTLVERVQQVYGPLGFPEPDSAQHRYFTEDIPFSLVPWSSLAAQVGVPVPLIDSMITLSGVLCDRDWYAEGRTAATLGLAGADAATVRSTFVRGAAVPLSA